MACIAIACVFATFWDRSPPLGGGVLTRGISFGALLWAALILPLVLEAALFVQWHRGFVIGLLLDWLVLCVLASLAAAYSVRAQLEDNPARWEVKVLEGGARCRLREESILCIDVSQYLSQVYHVALGAQIWVAADSAVVTSADQNAVVVRLKAGGLNHDGAIQVRSTATLAPAAQ